MIPMNKNILIIITLLLGLFITTSAQAQSHKLFFVFLNSNPDKAILDADKVELLQSAHQKNIERLASEGIMKAAGPFEGGGGMFILKTDNIATANEILQSDPAIKANRFLIEVFPLVLAHNDLCGAEEPYEMVTYQFVRTISNPEYFGDMDLMRADNRVFMSDLNNDNDFVVSQGNFELYNEGYLILDVADVQEAEFIIKQHPSVQVNQLNYEIKELWIAKGTFCKK